MIQSPRRLKAALYVRVSTRDKQDPETQRSQLRSFAESQNWEITVEYVDKESGSNPTRENFLAMLAAASRREFDVLLFWALDRLSREGALKTLQHLELLTSYGVGFRSFTEQYLDSCGIFRDAVIAILGTIAKQEKLRLQERVQAGMDRVKLSGQTKSGNPVGRPVRVFRRDEVVRLRSEGKSWSRIAKEVGATPTSVRRAFGIAKTPKSEQSTNTPETNPTLGVKQ
jgi:DNA invertase Pin-like site-specific DNA recombinase